MRSEDRLARERWLRERGLPLIIDRRRRASGLLVRATPMLVGLTLVALAALFADRAVAGFDSVDEVELTGSVVVWLLAALVTAVCAIPAWLLTARLIRGRTRTTRVITAAVVLVVWFFGLAVVGALITSAANLQVSWWERIVGLAIVLAMYYFEVPSVARWGAARAWRELSSMGHMIARVLPVLMITMLLVFFTNELWQVMVGSSSARVWAINGFIAALIVILVVTATVDTLQAETGSRREFDAALLADTPFAGYTGGQTRPLRLGEQINLAAAPAAIQLVQVAIFVLLLHAFFVSFGSVALTQDLIRTWTGQASINLHMVGLDWPIDRTLWRVSLLLSTFSGLSFAASNITDDYYKRVFLAPVLDELRVNLAARDAYTATRR